MELKELYETIPTGAEAAVSITALSVMWGVSERKARKLIEEMIYKDLYVCNLRSGYFRPSCREELEAYSNIIHSYKIRLERKAYRLNKGVENWDNTRMAL